MTELSATDKATVDGIVATEMARTKLPGVLVATSGPRGSYVKPYGLSNRGNWLGGAGSLPLVPSDHYRIGSCTKMFTATAILIQMDRGNLRLSDKIDQFLAGIPAWGDITIEHLLMHRSGIYNYTDAWLSPYYANPADPIFTTENALTLALAKPLLFPPGSKWSYSNTNYLLLGLVLEKLTGKPVAEVITDDVLSPLGLDNTIYPITSAISAPFSHGYNASVVFRLFNWWWYKDVTISNPGYGGAAGGMISSIGDMLKFAESLHTEPLLSAEMRELRRTLFTPMDDVYFYGLGIARLPNGWVGHSGLIIGYETAAYHDPRTGAALVTMGNLQGYGSNTAGIVNGVIDALYPPMATPGTPVI